MYRRGHRIATLIIIALLIALFTVPRAYLMRTGRQLMRYTAAAAASVAAKQPCDTQLTALAVTFERRAPVLKLFLHHAAVDAVDAAIAGAQPLTEPDALLSALNTVDAAVMHLLSIETLGMENLL